jgi:methionyl-tRNA formyltransferase
MTYRLGIAGSTKHTAAMAEALAVDARFEIAFTLSPSPRPVGRTQALQKNPLQLWSEAAQVPVVSLEKKILPELRSELEKFGELDLLLVVDFGYLIPEWLLDYPKIAPLNIHPSALPKWRGSSPGQFVLLHQNLVPESVNSAITLMVMDQALDQGPVIAQLSFTVQPEWTQSDYYQRAFDLLAPQLADLVADFAAGKLQAQAQPLESPTPIARRLSKNDSFVAFENLRDLMAKNEQLVEPPAEQAGLLTEMLQNRRLCPTKSAQMQLICNASRAFAPWPGLWSLVQTNQGAKRLKILSCHLENKQLVLDEVHPEGKEKCLYREYKNAILD